MRMFLVKKGTEVLITDKIDLLRKNAVAKKDAYFLLESILVDPFKVNSRFYKFQLTKGEHTKNDQYAAIYVESSKVEVL